jgi:hypothetical protein
MESWREALDSVRQHPEVIAAAPEVLTKSIVTNSAEYPAAVDVVGFSPDTGLMAVTTLADKVSEGGLSFKTSADTLDGGIVLGYRLANRLSVYPGDVVRLVSPASIQVNRATGQRIPQFWFFEVTGTFDGSPGWATPSPAYRSGSGIPGKLPRSGTRCRPGWATRSGRWTGRARIRVCSARSSWKSSPWA